MRDLFSNITILFKNSNKKSTQIRHICSQIYALLFLLKVFQFDKSEGVDFKYENSYLKFYHKNIEITRFCIFPLVYFCKILQFDKFGGADFKYGINYFQSLRQIYPNKAFLVRNFGIFFFRESFKLDKFECAVFKYDNTLKILPK